MLTFESASLDLRATIWIIYYRIIIKTVLIPENDYVPAKLGHSDDVIQPSPPKQSCQTYAPNQNSWQLNKQLKIIKLTLLTTRRFSVVNLHLSSSTNQFVLNKFMRVIDIII